MQRKRFLGFLKGILFVQIFLLIIIAGLSWDVNRKYLEGIEYLSWERIYLPFSGAQITERQAELLLQENNVLLAGFDKVPDKVLAGAYNTAAFSQGMLGDNIQALALAKYEYDETAAYSEKDTESTEGKLLAKVEKDQPAGLDSETLARFQESQIFLYCTHSGESYIPNSGKARLDGERGLVNQAAASIESSLNKSGLPAHFIDTIHDANYDKSYTQSRITVSNIVEANKNILGLFDIHRDHIAGESKASTVKLNGEQCARILIVVGTDDRKPHPHWQENFAFAEKIYRQGEKMYPGLIKGVMTRSGTYHQEYHPRALLLEFGTDLNSLEQVNQSARLFTEILIEVLKEDT